MDNVNGSVKDNKTNRLKKIKINKELYRFKKKIAK